MIELLFIVVPCTIIGCALVLVAMKMGWLPTLEGRPAQRSRFSDGPRPAPGSQPDTRPRPAPGTWGGGSASASATSSGGRYYADRSILDRRSAWQRRDYTASSWGGFHVAGVVAIVLMAAWIVFWFVLFIIGIHLILSAA